jgi:hypothetical protein
LRTIRLIGYADAWQEIIWTERQELFATPERLVWIEANYSDTDVGRPGLFAPSDKNLRASKRGKVRNADDELHEADEGVFADEEELVVVED